MSKSDKHAELEAGIQQLIEMAADDYQVSGLMKRDRDHYLSQFKIDSLHKYYKVSRGGKAWCFVLKTCSDRMFEYGDILKPVSQTKPFRSVARGNVLDKASIRVSHRGPLDISELEAVASKANNHAE